ncbi:uncharacterized protein LOC122015116 [Zingiber officinale]|uniref:Uncharacterized protein n=1 Tax=Zingiber officinale TaxID=94328 RepID=A0A8J5FEH4_ZINOF|nr:uncharacterized protein LOC122015116 [Zingiber officinale]KAG6481599.1 hypothetical protein ZIOFF_058203 [Zingiber officinale]
MDRLAPLPISPRSLHTRCPPPSHSILSQISQTPRLTGTPKKRKPLNRSSPALSISRRSTAARVGSATGDDSVAPTVGIKSPLFERGRLYDLYSARRNERLERKMAECSEAVAVVTEDPAVAVVLAKRLLSKKAESARKSVLGHFSGSRGSSSRSAVGSSKEKRKAGSSFAECSAARGRKRNGSGSVRWL